MTSPLRRRAGSRLMQSCWGPGPAMWLWAERRQNSQRHPERARARRWLCRVSPQGVGTSASLAGGRRLDLGRLGADAAGTGRYLGLGTEYSLDSRRVDQLHRLVDLEEGLEAWRGGGGREGHGVKRGRKWLSPWDTSQVGLTCAGLKGWQHGHKHIVQEERAAVHSDGAGQQPAEVADVAGEMPRKTSAPSSHQLNPADPPPQPRET